MKHVIHEGKGYGILNEGDKYYIEYEYGEVVSTQRQDEITSQEFNQIMSDPEGEVVTRIILKAKTRGWKKEGLI